MKNYISLLLIMLIMLIMVQTYSCSDDQTTNNTTNPPTIDTSIIYSKDSIICDWRDSIWLPPPNTYWFREIDSSNAVNDTSVNKVRIRFISFTNQPSQNPAISLDIAAQFGQITQGDTFRIIQDNEINNTFDFTFNITYNPKRSFKFYISAGIPGASHDAYIRITNIKVTKSQ